MPEFSSFAEYRAAARQFMGGGTSRGVLQGTRADGAIVRLDPNTGYFGVRGPGGAIRTFFRPDGGRQDWLDYYRSQFP